MRKILFFFLLIPSFAFSQIDTLHVVIGHTANVVPSPVLSVVPSSLAFGSVDSGSNSASQSFMVTGSNLTSGVTVTAPTGFEVSLSSVSGFSSRLIVSQSGGVVNQTIYARFFPLAVQSYSGNVVNLATGVSPLNVTVTGTGTASPAFITEAYVGMWEPSFAPGDGGHMNIKVFDYGLWNRFIVFNVRPDSSTDSLTTSYPTLLTATNMQTWADSVHSYGNKLICCIGVNGQDFRGWLGYQRGAASVPDTLHMLMGKLANFASAYHFDGFDIDWEQQVASDTVYWKMLIDSLAANFSNISVTGQEGSMYSEYASVAPDVTCINIMTYDLTSYASPGWNSWFNYPVYSGTEVNALGNPNASIASVTANFINAGSPRKKLIIASSPVGNLWVEDTNTVMTNYNNTSYTHAGPDSFNLSWQFSWSSNSSLWLKYAPKVSGDIAWYNPGGTGIFQKYLPAANPVYSSDTVVANGFNGYVHSHWDSVHEASWMSHDSTDSMTTWYMAFEGIQDMGKKIQYVADSTLGGYMVYELGEGYNYTTPPSGYMPYQEYIRQQILDIWKQNP